MSSAPDSAEPLIGYRAWRIEKGRLLPAGQPQAGPWERGINTAKCLAWQPGAGKRRLHRAPIARCTCGLYALGSPFADQLRHARLPYGAIAAWGAIQVYKSGFRAQHACVVALAITDTLKRFRAHIEQAAAYYGVPVVSLALLELEACRHGRPLSRQLVTKPRPPKRRPAITVRSAPNPRPAQAGASAFWPERHVFAQYDGSHVVTGPTRALWARALPGRAVLVAPPGAYVARGAAIASIPTDAGELAVESPLCGQVVQVNLSALAPGSADSPTLAVRPAWVARLRPIEWSRDIEQLAWGEEGERRERAILDLAGDGADVFAPLRRAAEERLSPPRREWAHLRHRPGPQASGFADTHDAVRVLASFLERRLIANRRLRQVVRSLETVLEFRLREPDARVAVALSERRGGDALVSSGPRVADPDVALLMDGTTAHRYWLGDVDIAAAVRAGEIGIIGSKVVALSAMSVLGRLRAEYESHLAEIGWQEPAAA